MNAFQPFTTEPHGEQTLTQVEPCSDRIGNRLFELRDREGHSIVMTGEEVTSLTRQWLEMLMMLS